MKIIVFILIFFSVFVQISAQEFVIKGYINDKDNNPLKKVEVKNKKSNKVVFSNKFGYFEIKTQKNDILEFSREDLKTLEVKIGDNTILNVIMVLYSEIDIFDLTLEDLMSIKVVTATKKVQELSESPSVISVITSEQIKYRGYNNIAEVLNSLSGIYVLNDHYQYNLGIRGVNGGMDSWSRVIKLMINNQPVSFTIIR